MKRKTKNIVMILIIFVLCVANFFTISYAGKSLSTEVQSQNGIPDSSFEKGGTPPSMNSNTSQTNEDFSNTSDSAQEMKGSRGNFGQRFQRSSDSNDSNERPQRPSDSNSANSNDSDSNDSSQTPPEMPGGENGSSPSGMPDNGSKEPRGFDGDQGMQFPSQMSSSSNSSIGIVYYLLFGVEGLLISSMIIYLFMSSFNKKSFKETFEVKDKIVICVLSTIILTSGLVFGDSYLAKNYFSGSSTSNHEVSESSEASGATTVDGNSKTLTSSYDSTTSDESSILVKNGGSATIKGAKVSKSGDSTNTENSEFNGVNAGILVQKGSSAKISKATIKTSAKGSNAVFATGEDSKIEISDSTITTTGESSARGLDATYGGYIKADNVTIKTEGGSCASLATDRGEGTVIADDSDLETNGSGSPVIYSTGDISINNTKGVANGSQMVVIEGKNSATVTNSTLKASGKGNRGDVDNAGVMIYQSMSGDASEGTGNFTSKDSTLEIDSSSDYYKSAPMFFITNTSAVINLENTKLVYGSNILISAKGTSEWGNSGSNGGNVTLNATNQDLEGNIEVDNISSATINLTKSTYKGTINGDNSAKEVTLKLDKNSKITLTGDSYVTSLDDADSSYSNIDFNGYKLYVNGKAIN